jgi:ABC-type Fe3+ transport system substrate-binding protein
MIAAGEDPFATNMLIQSADKLTIDIAKNTNRKLPFTWDKFAKPEYKDGVFALIRETYNFFKHADEDHDEQLHVMDIALFNVL